MSVTSASAFKTPEYHQQAINAYNGMLADWPVDYIEQTVKTSFGYTWLIRCGDTSKPPLILLHGGAGNSSMWIYNIDVLSQHYCVYLIDIIGEAGKSNGYRPSLMTMEFEQWLNEVVTSLSLDSIHLCGLSLGGIIAQRYACRYPHKIQTLLLASPANLISLNKTFIIFAIFAHLFPVNAVIKRFLKFMANGYPQFSTKAIDAFVTIYQAYKPNENLKDIPLISDDEIKALPKKTLVVIGQDDVIYVPKIALKRLSMNKHIKSKLIAGANHTLNADVPQIFNKLVIEHCR